MFPTRDASGTGPWFGCGPPGKHHPLGMERGCPRLLLPCQKSWQHFHTREHRLPQGQGLFGQGVYTL